MADTPMELVLITGMSGSGKSVALHALEDAGYYCVDNLPPQLLLDFVALQAGAPAARVAIAMDVRSAKAFPQVPAQLERLRAQGMAIKTLFLDASTETLVRRYSETRRRHPLSQADAVPGDAQHALVEAIELERRMLETMRAQSYVIDSSMIRASQLQSFVKSLITAPVAQLTLVFQSFAFKRGIPSDADYVFECACCPTRITNRCCARSPGAMRRSLHICAASLRWPRCRRTSPVFWKPGLMPWCWTTAAM